MAVEGSPIEDSEPMSGDKPSPLPAPTVGGRSSAGHFIQGLLVALLAFSGAIGVYSFMHNQDLAIVLVFVCISALFYCLGSAAVITSKLWMLTGASAVFFICYFSYIYYHKNDYAYFRIAKIAGATAQISSGQQTFFGAINPNNGDYDFVVLNGWLSADNFTIKIFTGQTDLFVSTCVDPRRLGLGMGLGKQVTWYFDRKKHQIVDAEGGVVAKDECGPVDASLTGIAVAETVLHSLVGIGTARAASAEIDGYVADLQSGLPDVRAAARVGLVKSGRDAIPAILALLRASGTSQSVMLDIFIAFKEMLRTHGASASAFDAALTDADIDLILEVSKTSDSRALRIQAVEFLASLASPRLFDRAARKAAESDLGSRDAYNYSYIAKENSKAASKEGLTAARQDFERLGGADVRVKDFTKFMYGM